MPAKEQCKGCPDIYSKFCLVACPIHAFTKEEVKMDIQKELEVPTKSRREKK